MPTVLISMTRTGWKRAVVEVEIPIERCFSTRALEGAANQEAARALDRAMSGEAPWDDEHDSLVEVQAIHLQSGGGSIELGLDRSRFPESRADDIQIRAVQQIFGGIDWKLFHEQKNALISVLNHPRDYPGDNACRTLDGLLNLMDAIQDTATDVLGIEEARA
jgi:hypothetical protein